MRFPCDDKILTFLTFFISTWKSSTPIIQEKKNQLAQDRHHIRKIYMYIREATMIELINQLQYTTTINRTSIQDF